MKYFWKLCAIFILLGLTILLGCSKRSERFNEPKTEEKSSTEEPKKSNKVSDTSNIEISKIVFFLENSRSLQGYVNGDTDFKTSLTALAHFPDFDNVEKTFYFISGRDNNCKVDLIGNNSETLENGLIPGEYIENYSNLTKMFEIALDSSQNNNISILITDGLYDVGESDNPKNALEKEVEKTQEAFRNKLNNKDIETIIIKAYSNFNGRYCYASTSRSETINQQRPYYIFLFGNSKLLNGLSKDSFYKKIKGFDNIARFQIIDESKIPFQATSLNYLGNFKFDRSVKNKLNDVKPDRNGQGFQFSFATNFSSLPYSDSYFETTDNYSCSDDNYTVTSVTKIKKKVYEITEFTPTHLITVFTQKSPYCKLKVSLKNVVPIWIDNTNSDDESNIESNTTQTFGFKFLTNAISDAYSYKNKENNITNFTFEINGNNSSGNSILITFFILGILIFGIILLIKYKS